MSTQIQITKQLTADGWEITGAVQPGGNLPAEIFVYANTGDNTLGEFQAVASVEDLGRLQIFTGTAIPVFGNRFVRYGQIKIQVSPGADVDTVISTLVSSIQKLSTDLQNQQTNTQIVTVQ